MCFHDMQYYLICTRRHSEELIRKTLTSFFSVKTSESLGETKALKQLEYLEKVKPFPAPSVWTSVIRRGMKLKS